MSAGITSALHRRRVAIWWRRNPMNAGRPNCILDSLYALRARISRYIMVWTFNAKAKAHWTRAIAWINERRFIVFSIWSRNAFSYPSDLLRPFGKSLGLHIETVWRSSSAVENNKILLLTMSRHYPTLISNAMDSHSIFPTAVRVYCNNILQ